MSYLPEDRADDSPRAVLENRFPSREQVWDTIKRTDAFDVIVVGGGIHGAAAARLAAFNGLKVALFERDDYASATSSRSSKLVHGGLRYLAYGDIRQVLDGVRARESWCDAAPHLVHAARFLIPIQKKYGWDFFKYGLGLRIYDYFLRDRSRSHCWRSSRDLEALAAILRPGLAGGFEYADAIMDDARLTVATIVSAREEGALCLNYAEVVHVLRQKEGQVLVAVKDIETGKTLEVSAGVVLNCAGPWIADVAKGGQGRLRDQIRLSRGSHLLFPKPWTAPALFLETVGASSAYFVLPHPGGTLIGTTERAVEHPERDPLPAADEIAELCARVQHDLPGGNFHPSEAHYCYAGIRTLPHASGHQSLHAVSRRARWVFSNGVLTLVGGKYTTAQVSAFEGLTQVFKLAQLSRAVVSDASRRLSGASSTDALAEFFAAAEREGIERSVQQRALARFGGWCSRMAEIPEWLTVLPGGLLRGEVELACMVEQARTVSDVLRRRLGAVYLPDHGFPVIGGVVEVLRRYRDPERAAGEESAYREHVQNALKILINAAG